MSEYRKTIENLIRDILGDFPQGFNRGFAAGVPGWAGDMAYLAQEYPRALLTDTPLRPPVEYAGTTDSIAKAAGYEIPGTFSGQLGAAVGGLLSPGPGDLAKFAPLLSAIPFWHGSPHKFDAFDLSKMGTGEGAQAYGWGAYGADSADVAKTYVPRDYDMEGDLLALYKAAEGRQDYDAMQVFEDAMLHKTADEIAAVYPDRNFADAIEKVRVLERKQNGHLYRGEYAWPDPAKEAATPLTGEDLLQWDKPLSEQPETVRKALGIKVRDYAAEDALVSRAQQLGVPLHEMPGYEELTRLLDEASNADRMTGRDFYMSLARNNLLRNGEGSNHARYASDRLKELGIPGIRYLDGQSRDGGSGTYNYVMFDDKGIKLLERNGRPIGGLLDKKR